MKKEFNKRFQLNNLLKVDHLLPELSLIIAGGFSKCGDVIFAKKLANPSFEDIQSLMIYNKDLTGVECYLNKMHIEYFCEKDITYNHGLILAYGVYFIDLVASTISQHYQGELFRFILSEEEGEFPSVVFRFHRIRDGESWLTSDLETYDNGVYYLDSD